MGGKVWLNYVDTTLILFAWAIIGWSLLCNLHFTTGGRCVPKCVYMTSLDHLRRWLQNLEIPRGRLDTQRSFSRKPVFLEGFPRGRMRCLTQDWAGIHRFCPFLSYPFPSSSKRTGYLTSNSSVASPWGGIFFESVIFFYFSHCFWRQGWALWPQLALLLTCLICFIWWWWWWWWQLHMS